MGSDLLIHLIRTSQPAAIGVLTNMDRFSLMLFKNVIESFPLLLEQAGAGYVCRNLNPGLPAR